MNQNTKFNAAILIIGNEILSGRTQDTNTSTIAQWLNSIGVKVNEVSHYVKEVIDIDFFKVKDKVNIINKS